MPNSLSNKAKQPKKRPNLPIVNSFEILKYPHKYWHRSNVKAKYHFLLPNHFKKGQISEIWPSQGQPGNPGLASVILDNVTEAL